MLEHHDWERIYGRIWSVIQADQQGRTFDSLEPMARTIDPIVLNSPGPVTAMVRDSASTTANAMRHKS